MVVSPEQAFKTDGGFMKLWRKPDFTSRILSVVWDEAHCVSAWGRFRKDYADAGRLRYIIPRTIPYLLPSATFPTHVRDKVLDILQVQRQRLEIIHRSNDRPNIYITVRKIKHSLTSFKDLDFLLLRDWKPGDPIRKFLIFFDNIEDSIQAMEVLEAQLPLEHRLKLATFNSDNTPTFRERVTSAYREGKMYGLYCTDAFGMVSDLRFSRLSHAKPENNRA